LELKILNQPTPVMKQSYEQFAGVDAQRRSKIKERPTKATLKYGTQTKPYQSILSAPSAPTITRAKATIFEFLLLQNECKSGIFFCE
jgi:hypothetical protein